MWHLFQSSVGFGQIYKYFISHMVELITVEVHLELKSKSYHQQPARSFSI